jgi:RimJ/RimL family protein N-acetyltransferase
VALIEPGNAASERVAVKVGMSLEKDVLRPGGRTMRLYATR